MKEVRTTQRNQALLLVLCAWLALIPGCSRKPSEPRSTDVAGPWQIQFKISPAHPSMAKPVGLALHITDERGQPVSDAQVNGALSMKVMDMGTTQVKFVPRGNGDYEASTNIDMSGAWSLAVDAAQANVHVKKSFDVTVAD